MKFQTEKSIIEVANFLNRPYIGDASLIVKGINEINRCEDGDIIFVGHEKYFKKAIESSAKAIITSNSNTNLLDGKVAIISPEPFEDFNKIIAHEKYNYSKAKKLVYGKNTFIHPNVVTGKNVEIGDNCYIHSNVVLYDNVKIGNNTTVNANTVVGSPAFYFQKQNNKYTSMETCGEVIIGNDVEIGASCTIDAGVTNKTTIGDGTKIDNQVHIGHDCIIGENCLFAAQVGIAGCNTIEDNVVLWGQVGIPSNLNIGKGAILLGQSGPARDVPAGKIYFGSPAELSIKKFKQLAALKKLPEIIKNLKL